MHKHWVFGMSYWGFVPLSSRLCRACFSLLPAQSSRRPHRSALRRHSPTAILPCQAFEIRVVMVEALGMMRWSDLWCSGCPRRCPASHLLETSEYALLVGGASLNWWLQVCWGFDHPNKTKKEVTLLGFLLPEGICAYSVFSFWRLVCKGSVAVLWLIRHTQIHCGCDSVTAGLLKWNKIEN